MFIKLAKFVLTFVCHIMHLQSNMVLLCCFAFVSYLFSSYVRLKTRMCINDL